MWTLPTIIQLALMGTGLQLRYSVYSVVRAEHAVSCRDFFLVGHLQVSAAIHLLAPTTHDTVLVRLRVQSIYSYNTVQYGFRDSLLLHHLDARLQGTAASIFENARYRY